MHSKEKNSGADWVRTLVGIDTISAKSNLGLIEMVRDDLVRQGLSPHLIYDGQKIKANLFCTIPAANGSEQGGLMLSGHTDVVPVEGQAWTTDPFKPEIREGKIFGRGSTDMKGFIGVVLSLVPEMLAANLQRPIHLALSFDEEVGCLGARILLKDLQQRGVHPEGCIVGEPTSMRPVIAHKGIYHYHCALRGHEVHSSLTPSGVNAIEYAAKLICFIRDIADQFSEHGPFDTAFDVPYTTAQTGIITGNRGAAVNIVPNACEFDFEFRTLPKVNSETIIHKVRTYVSTLEAEMKKSYPASAIIVQKHSDAPPLEIAEEEALVVLVRSFLPHPIGKVAYGTEGGLFMQAGIPTLVCGPGSIKQAHRPDEFVELAQLEECRAFLQKIIHHLQTTAK